MLHTESQIAMFFGVTVERIREQYSENAKALKQMHNKSIRTGKKVNGYTELHLSEMVAEYELKAKGGTL